MSRILPLDVQKNTINKTASTDELLQIANYWKLQDNMEKAELYIQKAIKLEPEDLSLKMKLARFYFNGRRYEDSRVIVEKLIVLSSENRPLKKYLIKILLAQNQLERMGILQERAVYSGSQLS